MIGPRYLALIKCKPDHPPASSSDVSAPLGLTLQYQSASITIFAEASSGRTIELGGNRGVILGVVFARGNPEGPIDTLQPGIRTVIWGSHGDHLINGFWGSYVALLGDDHGATDIICAPMSHVPCYYIRTDDGIVLASDVELIFETGLVKPNIDWVYIRQHLLRPALRTSRTGLTGITELLWGERLRISPDGAVRAEETWSPWDYAAPERRISRMDIAASTVRSAVEESVAGWASLSSHILLGVSGGLDSSILAACLARCGAHVDLVTFVSDDAVGDEREFARPLAEALGIGLIEACDSPDVVDLSRSDAAHLPRPLARSFAQSGDRILSDLAGSRGATSIWSGGGGDNVFCSLQSTVPVADRLRVEGPWLGALRTARNLSVLTGAAIPEILVKAIGRAWWRSPAYPWQEDASFLLADREGDAVVEPMHPWLDVPAGGLAGSAAHIAQIHGIRNSIEGYGRDRNFACVYPLLSQPVVEACLRVPSWLWCGPGLNRMVARIAFADQLPSLIIERRSKGSPGGFVMQIYESRREEIATILTSGHLARAGLLDLEAVRATVLRSGPVRGGDYSRIMTLVDVEAWIASWVSRGACTTPA